jgi:beta-glucosidase-like glycosyl hydrolase
VSHDIFFGDEAEAEYIAAAQWYEQRRSRLGIEFLDAVDTTLHHIARFPHAGSLFPRTDPELLTKDFRSGAFHTTLST